MECQICCSQLTALLDSELPPEQAREIESHLASCPDCQGSARHNAGGLWWSPEEQEEEGEEGEEVTHVPVSGFRNTSFSSFSEQLRLCYITGICGNKCAHRGGLPIRHGDHG